MEKHFCVSVYVYDEKEQKDLLIKHKKMGLWVQPGGHVEPNESMEEAAIREVYEETDGIKWYSLDEINDSNFETFDDVREWCKYIIDNY